MEWAAEMINKSITQISETLVKRKNKSNIGLSGIPLFAYAVYILCCIFYIQQFFLSETSKLSYRYLSIKEKIK